MDQLPGPRRDADLVSVPDLEADSRRLAGLGILDRHLGDVKRRFRPLQPALWIGLARLAVTRDDVDARDQHLALLGHGFGHFAVLALVPAGQDDDAVAFLDLLRGHYRTSGARLMIFICFLALNSRTTGPKMRVPIGSALALTRTAALESKRMVEPSGRWMSLAVRTITALWTSPFLTRPRGAASLTETTMMSPTPAKRRLEPPSTLMHWTRFAPLLSATSRLDCIWIIDPIPSSLQPGRARRSAKLSGLGRFGLDLFRGLLLRLGLAHRLLLGLRLGRVGVGGAEHPPGLELGDRPRLLDANDLAFLIF